MRYTHWSLYIELQTDFRLALTPGKSFEQYSGTDPMYPLVLVTHNYIPGQCGSQPDTSNTSEVMHNHVSSLYAAIIILHKKQ